MFDRREGNPIRVPKAADVLASRIRKAIVRGDLKVGEKLPREAELISEFEVSRPTVREAIRILESEGLITVSRGSQGGARVNTTTGNVITRAAGVALQARGATLGDIYTARTIIEPPAARLAAELNAAPAAAALRLVLDEARKVVGDPLKMAQAVAEFHRVLLAECGNVVLSVVGQALQDVVDKHMKLANERERNLVAKRDKRTAEVGLRSYEKLIGLIEREEADEAEAHWTRHMHEVERYWVGRLSGTAAIDVLE
ncbi:MAG: GntR family transcriptional regulator [Pseudomonadota bacterium]